MIQTLGFLYVLMYYQSIFLKEVSNCNQNFILNKYPSNEPQNPSIATSDNF